MTYLFPAQIFKTGSYCCVQDKFIGVINDFLNTRIVIIEINLFENKYNISI